MLCSAANNVHTSLPSLEPGQTYFYMFGDTFGVSEEYTFTVPPGPSPDSSVRVVVYGGELVFLYSLLWVQGLCVFGMYRQESVGAEMFVCLK